jgi:hypothetical protein
MEPLATSRKLQPGMPPPVNVEVSRSSRHIGRIGLANRRALLRPWLSRSPAGAAARCSGRHGRASPSAQQADAHSAQDFAARVAAAPWRVRR